MTDPRHDIVDTAVAAGSFSTLVAAVTAAGLVETLKGAGPFTVFAPSDDAFAALPAGTVETLVKPENKDQLTAILLLHVVPGKVMAADVAGQVLDPATAGGATVHVDGTNGVTVDGAKVVTADIECTNGVIHVIDAVILPKAGVTRRAYRTGTRMKIAIVGAGIAGASCAETLQARGHTVLMFDKGRGPGGRMATRRAPGPDGDVAFDHGAQYFTARDSAFAAQVAQWAAANVTAAWPSAGDDAWVGTPGMSAVVKAIAERLDVHWTTKVDTIRQDGAVWKLDPVSDMAFDAVVIATPAEQAAPLLVAHDPAMAAMAQACPSAPCWTAMVAFDEPIAIATDILRDTGILGWAARNSAKPGRGAGEAWVLQATPDWSRLHLEDAAESVVDALLAALADQATRALPPPTVRIGHRWRYARVKATQHGALWNPAKRIGAVGDWLLAPRIESAWLSGRMLADRIGPA